MVDLSCFTEPFKTIEEQLLELYPSMQIKPYLKYFFGSHPDVRCVIFREALSDTAKVAILKDSVDLSKDHKELVGELFKQVGQAYYLKYIKGLSGISILNNIDLFSRYLNGEIEDEPVFNPFL